MGHPRPRRRGGNEQTWLIVVVAALALVLVVVAVRHVLRRPPSVEEEGEAPAHAEGKSGADASRDEGDGTGAAGVSEGPAPAPVLDLHFAPTGATERGRVVKVVDGDTVWLEGRRKVRLIGINTPERDTPYFQQAKELTHSLAAGATATLEFDRDRRDQYGRTLGYLFVDGHFVNGELVRRGLAYCYTWEPNTRYRELLLRCQKAARRERLGLWKEEPAPATEYIWDAKRHHFHRPDCPEVQRIPPRFRKRSTDRNVPLDLGFNPCRRCRP